MVESRPGFWQPARQAFGCHFAGNWGDAVWRISPRKSGPNASFGPVRLVENEGGRGRTDTP